MAGITADGAEHPVKLPWLSGDAPEASEIACCSNCALLCMFSHCRETGWAGCVRVCRSRSLKLSHFVTPFTTKLQSVYAAKPNDLFVDLFQWLRTNVVGISAM